MRSRALRRLAAAPWLLAALAASAGACGRGERDGGRGGAAADPVGAGRASAPATGDELVMVDVPPRVGDTRTRTKDARHSFTVRRDGRDRASVFSVHQERHEEVLAVEAGAITRIAVTYRADARTRGGEVEPTVLAGKRYQVWLEGDAIAARRADGAAVSAEELAALASAHDELGQPPVLDQLLAARRWRRDELVALSAAEVARLDAVRRGTARPRLVAMSLTLREVAGGVATFALTTSSRQEGAGGLAFDGAGTLRLDVARLEPLSLELTGTLAGQTDSGELVGASQETTTYAY